MNVDETMPAEMFEKIEVQKPTHEEIAVAAYYIWLSEGCPEGCAERHWYEAEMQLIRMRQAEALEKMKNQSASSERVSTSETKSESAATNTATTEPSSEQKETPVKSAPKKKKSASSTKRTKKSAK